MFRFVIYVIAVLLFSSCSNPGSGDKESNYKGSVVELVNNDGKYRLFVNGEEFYIEGAGLEYDRIHSLAQHGANAFRTWGIDNGHVPSEELLDSAHANGLMVFLGLDVKKERKGFDYNDPVAVQNQLEEMKADIIKYKDHPALLGWGIGNELNLEYSNMKVWDAVQGLAEMIKEVDGNHPVTTMLAGINKVDVDYIMEHCPALDFLSIQMYGDIINLPTRIEESGYEGPYMVSEWGATGHWEVGKTSWNAPVEQTSTEKAAAIKERYEKAIFAEKNLCVGSFIFLWGQKQERTPTWYGLITENDEFTEAIDVMYTFWNDKEPENHCPQIISQKLDGIERFDNITLIPGEKYKIELEVSDADGDPLEARVEVLPESTDLKIGGDRESRPPTLEELHLEVSPEEILFHSPENPGAYRIFVYITDGNQHCATINFPFLVKGK